LAKKGNRPIEEESAGEIKKRAKGENFLIHVQWKKRENFK
jgi:hypothetical protein